ncbi:unnamed protein product [Tuber melanosporum]|uniref:(Perigord truffle) hypothetical protein n=1 Tax=Tuber melanosporum (strain Mel28) TaxID=656061 RepID=D5G9G4_TUBMM|nr:uncharacterized protein GSTUM_00003389001 [Tuber melanosporum]CAZ81157.1 unnamed protein product [Tuber melanosporum]
MMALTSEVFSGLCLIALAGIVLLLQRHYLPLRTTPEYLIVATFFPLLISCSIVILVPIDLASSSAGDDGSRGIVLHERVLLVSWRVAYWLCFVLTWAVLPMLQSYSSSGHRSPRNRLLEALRENARYQLMVLSVGLVGLVYVFITSGVHLYSLKSLVMALSYFYALSIAIFLMGHGLVAVPRGIMRNASISGKLRRIQMHAPRAYDKLLDATNNLEDVEVEIREVMKRKNGSAREFQDWIGELGDMLQLPESAIPVRSRAGAPPVITEQYLASLTRRFKIATHKKARFNSEWQALVQSAADAQAVLDSSRTKRLKFTNHFSGPSIFEKMPFLNAYTRHVLYYYVLPYFYRVIAAFLALASSCIVWSELVHGFTTKLSLVSYTVIHHPSSTGGRIGFAGQAIAAAWIAYMCACAYSSLTTVKVWGTHALVKRMTSGSSACFYASYAARLTVPLAYNFTGLLDKDVLGDETVFYKFLGKLINLTPLGEGFDGYFPVLILLPVAATGFGFYGWVKGMFGISGDVMEDEDEDEDIGTGGWREGSDLIERELLGASGSSTGIRNLLPAARVRSPVVGAGASRTSREQPRLGRTGPIHLTDSDEADAAPQEGFLGGFFHRVKNTLDTVETPGWIEGLKENVKKPKWMSGEGGSSSGAPRPRWPRFGDGDDESGGLLGRR